jgi:hypothetical protein
MMACIGCHGANGVVVQSVTMSIPLPYFAKALFEYKAVEDTELSIAKGITIIPSTTCTCKWVLICYWFIGDFMTVEEINDTGTSSSSHSDIGDLLSDNDVMQCNRLVFS